MNRIKLNYIKLSNKYPKRFVAKFTLPDGTTKQTYFGDVRYQAYIDHHDKIRQQRYWKRHYTDLDSNDPTSPGYLSLYITWGYSQDINQNIKIYKNLFNIL